MSSIEMLDCGCKYEDYSGMATYLCEKHRDIDCADCGKPIYKEDDDAHVCIECGGMNRRKGPIIEDFEYEVSDKFGMLLCGFIGLYFILMIGILIIGDLIQGFEYFTCI